MANSYFVDNSENNESTSNYNNIADYKETKVKIIIKLNLEEYLDKIINLDDNIKFINIPKFNIDFKLYLF